MSEAIIAKRKKEITRIEYQNLLTSRANLIVQDSTFVMPDNVEGNKVDVLLAGSNSDTKNGEITVNSIELSPGEQVPIYIGEDGAPTSFGTYAIANGASKDSGVIGKDINNGNGYAIVTYDEKIGVDNNG